MSQDLWTAIDQYVTDQVVHEDDVLRGATRATVASGLPQIAVAPNQGKLLYLLARMLGARALQRRPGSAPLGPQAATA